jgi:hypothetical protein
MPGPCHSPAMPCRQGFRLCLSRLIYAFRPCLIHTYHAGPTPCHKHDVLKDASKGHGTARHGNGMEWHGMAWRVWINISSPETAYGLPIPRSFSSGYHAEFHEGCYQKHTDPLNCRTSSSDISGYHADFHEGHDTVGAWQGRGMAWARHGMCELAVKEPFHY